LRQDLQVLLIIETISRIGTVASSRIIFNKYRMIYSYLRIAYEFLTLFRNL